jgi:GNAT superfamily N-acetyltransferase
LRIRRARADDANTLAALRFEFRRSGRRVVESEGRFTRRCTRWMRERLVDPGWRCWVVVARGELIGHVWLHVIEKVPNPVQEAERHAYITNLYVRPGSRGAGFGGRLLAEALIWCRAHAIDSAILWPSPRSRSLYARHGFRASGAVFDLRLEGRSQGRPGRGDS